MSMHAKSVQTIHFFTMLIESCPAHLLALLELYAIIPSIKGIDEKF